MISRPRSAFTNLFVDVGKAFKLVGRIEVDMRQLVVILNCRNTTIQVPKKASIELHAMGRCDFWSFGWQVKSICVDSCEKVAG